MGVPVEGTFAEALWSSSGDDERGRGFFPPLRRLLFFAPAAAAAELAELAALAPGRSLRITNASQLSLYRRASILPRRSMASMIGEA
jgi:hypothetical protein